MKISLFAGAGLLGLVFVSEAIGTTDILCVFFVLDQHLPSSATSAHV